MKHMTATNTDNGNDKMGTMTMRNELQESVIDQLGDTRDECLEILKDVASHGADAGWSGFTYYSDTSEFYNANKRLILDRLEDDVENFGMVDCPNCPNCIRTNVIEMVKNFNCVDATANEIGEFLYGNSASDEEFSGDAEIMLANALAWYALETVAFDLDR